LKNSIRRNKKLTLVTVLLPLFIAGMLSSGCGAIGQLEASGAGDNEEAKEIAKAHLLALANSDSAGVCDSLSSQAEGQFSEISETVENLITTAEAQGKDMEMVPFDTDKIPADPVAYCKFDIELSRDLQKGKAEADRFSEGLRNAYFGEPKFGGDGITARIYAGVTIDSRQAELAYGLTKEGGSWKIDFLDFRVPGEGEGRLFPTDIDTAVVMWKNYDWNEVTE
jgi:hypothetical protein